MKTFFQNNCWIQSEKQINYDALDKLAHQQQGYNLSRWAAGSAGPRALTAAEGCWDCCVQRPASGDCFPPTPGCCGSWVTSPAEGVLEIPDLCTNCPWRNYRLRWPIEAAMSRIKVLLFCSWFHFLYIDYFFMYTCSKISLESIEYRVQKIFLLFKAANIHLNQFAIFTRRSDKLLTWPLKWLKFICFELN